MHPKTKAKYRTISKLILKLAAAGALSLLLEPGGRKSVIAKGGALASYGEEQIKRSLRYLRMQEYVRYEESEAHAPLVITSRGLERLNPKSLGSKIVNTFKKRWDHLWRLVAFDVPEIKKSGRDQFRRDLYGLGLFPYQKSLYITPLSCEKEIMALARKRGIGQYVLVSVTPNLGWRETYALRWFEKEIGK